MTKVAREYLMAFYPEVYEVREQGKVITPRQGVGNMTISNQRSCNVVVGLRTALTLGGGPMAVRLH